MTGLFWPEAYTGAKTMVTSAPMRKRGASGEIENQITIGPDFRIFRAAWRASLASFFSISVRAGNFDDACKASIEYVLQDPNLLVHWVS